MEPIEIQFLKIEKMKCSVLSHCEVCFVKSKPFMDYVIGSESIVSLAVFNMNRSINNNNPQVLTF